MDDQDRILRALTAFGAPQPVEDVLTLIDQMECFEGIRWLPQYAYTVNDVLWCVDCVADQVSPMSLASMASAQQKCEGLRVAVFVRDAEAVGNVVELCAPLGIDVIYPVDGLSAFYKRVPEQPVAAAGLRPSRIPPALADAARNLTNIDNSFAVILLEFSKQHEQLRGGDINDDTESRLLEWAFEQLLLTDDRYVGSHNLLDLLRKLESWARTGQFRDHYFHTFQDFLLGIILINQAYAHFKECVWEVMPVSGDDLKIEYIWLLTALFHDVGYAISRKQDLMGLVYGKNLWAGEAEGIFESEDVTAERSQAWESDSYHLIRSHLVSLFDHLRRGDIKEDWTPEAFPLAAFPDSPFDRAAQRNYVQDGHGTAGALRLCVEIGQSIRKLEDAETRRFLTRHLFLAALAIPFHDYRFRRELIDLGISGVTTRRFPFAALLTFIDSIQDDRREDELGEGMRHDILEGLQLDGMTVTAIVNLVGVPPEFLIKKQVEAGGVHAFLDCGNGITYQYPPEYLPND